MDIAPFKIATLAPPKDDLLSKIEASELTLEEHDVIALSSKVVSIHQGRTMKREGTDIDALIKREADQYLERGETPGGHVMHTLKEGLLMSNAGLDPFGGHIILLPKDPQETAEELLTWFKKTYKREHLYLVITDSRSVMLRRGVVGSAIAWAGFEPLYYNRKRTDLLGFPSAGSETNIPDSLAAAAVFVMGEANEGTPVVRLRAVPYIREGKNASRFSCTASEDIFAPFLTNVPWKKGSHEEA